HGRQAPITRSLASTRLSPPGAEATASEHQFQTIFLPFRQFIFLKDSRAPTPFVFSGFAPSEDGRINNGDNYETMPGHFCLASVSGRGLGPGESRLLCAGAGDYARHGYRRYRIPVPA